MPWLVCVKRVKLSVTERLFLMDAPIAVPYRNRRAANKDKQHKEYWSKSILMARVFSSRRSAAREAGRYKKCGGAEPFWYDTIQYSKLLMEATHA